MDPQGNAIENADKIYLSDDDAQYEKKGDGQFLATIRKKQDVNDPEKDLVYRTVGRQVKGDKTALRAKRLIPKVRAFDLGSEFSVGKLTVIDVELNTRFDEIAIGIFGRLARFDGILQSRNEIFLGGLSGNGQTKGVYEQGDSRKYCFFNHSSPLNHSLPPILCRIRFPR